MSGIQSPEWSVSQSVNRLLFNICTLLLCLCALVTSARAQVLPLVTEIDGEETRYWWQEPADPSLNLLDLALVDLGAVILDPRQAVQPVVSRSYRQPRLTQLSARNLASLYGAGSVLHGELEIIRIEPVADRLFWIATVRLECRLFDLAHDRTRFEVSRTFTGSGDNSEAALGAAVSAAAGNLSVGLTARAHDGGLPLPMATSPTILVRGADRASLLVAFKGDLRRYETVVADIWEAWASEGLIALEVALQSPSDEDALVDVLYQLEFDPDVAYELLVHSRDDLTVWVDLTDPRSAEEIEPSTDSPLVAPPDGDSTEPTGH